MIRPTAHCDSQPADEKRPIEASWQAALREAVRDPAELCRLLRLPARFAAGARAAAGDFPLFAPRSYLARIQPGDPLDPLLRQILPLAEELASPAGYSSDPVGDLSAVRSPGLLHKYQARVLIVTTGACAVHCRYCFRRHFPYSETPRASEDWQPAVDAIAADTTLTEVILSGGDPLTVVDSQLALLVDRLANIPHLRRLRVHTRLPIMIPERVNDELLAWLAGSRLTPVVVIHANHPRELDDDVAHSLARLTAAGVLLLNQSVLLRGVNDNVDVLAELSDRLLDLRVTPYYLHQLDRVRGAAHFEVDESRGQAIIEQLRARLPGYAVPRYVREVAGQTHKIPLV